MRNPAVITNDDGIIRVNGQTWAEFSSRYFNPHKEPSGYPSPFWACLHHSDGAWVWFDSASNYETAIHWVAYHNNLMDLSPEEEMELWIPLGQSGHYAIVSSSMLRDLWEKGLVI
jgi:hypothetical protein